MKCTNIHEYDAKETKYGEKVKRREKNHNKWKIWEQYVS